MRSDTWPPKSPIVGVDPMVFDGSPSCWIPLNSVFGSALRFFGRETQDVIPNGLLQIGLYFFHDGIVGPISGRGCMAGALEQRFSPPNLYRCSVGAASDWSCFSIHGVIFASSSALPIS